MEEEEDKDFYSFREKTGKYVEYDRLRQIGDRKGHMRPPEHKHKVDTLRDDRRRQYPTNVVRQCPATVVRQCPAYVMEEEEDEDYFLREKTGKFVEYDRLRQMGDRKGHMRPPEHKHKVDTLMEDRRSRYPANVVHQCPATVVRQCPANVVRQCPANMMEEEEDEDYFLRDKTGKYVEYDRLRQMGDRKGHMRPPEHKHKVDTLMEDRRSRYPANVVRQCPACVMEEGEDEDYFLREKTGKFVEYDRIRPMGDRKGHMRPPEHKHKVDTLMEDRRSRYPANVVRQCPATVVRQCPANMMEEEEDEDYFLREKTGKFVEYDRLRQMGDRKGHMRPPEHKHKVDTLMEDRRSRYPANVVRQCPATGVRQCQANVVRQCPANMMQEEEDEDYYFYRDKVAKYVEYDRLRQMSDRKGHMRPPELKHKVDTLMEDRRSRYPANVVRQCPTNLMEDDEKKAFIDRMMAKFEDDDRLYLMSDDKRRLMKSIHRRKVSKLINDRRRQDEGTAFS